MKYFVLASLLCLCACSDDNDNKNNEIPQDLVELKVDASEISIVQGDTRTVKITSGNGEYVVTSANEGSGNSGSGWRSGDTDSCRREK